MKLFLYLLIFWLLQIAACIAFKYGSKGTVGRSRRWLAGFIGGNIFGASSIYFLMKIYEQMAGNCNVAQVLATSGSFIGTQIALAWIFRTRLTPVQWGGVGLVVVGSAISMLGGRVAGSRSAEPEPVSCRGGCRGSRMTGISRLAFARHPVTLCPLHGIMSFATLRPCCMREVRTRSAGWFTGGAA